MPRCSSRFTRWCTAEVDSPVSFPSSVNDSRPSAVSAAMIRRSVSSIASATEVSDVAGTLVQPLRTVVGAHHDVFDPGAVATGEIDPRLDRERHARFEHQLVAVGDVGLLMGLDSDPVARTVQERLAIPRRLDDVAPDLVDRRRRDAGPYVLALGLLCVEEDGVVVAEV